MFDVGSAEFLVIVLVLLIFVGPKHLPAMARKFGRIVGELRMASRDLRNQIGLEMPDIEPPSKIIRDLRNDLIDGLPSPRDEMRKIENQVKKELSAVNAAMGSYADAYADEKPIGEPTSEPTSGTGEEAGADPKADPAGSPGAGENKGEP